ncbi:hypothetical protein ARMSODRAFT_981928 [Armillaria solidipes]|uniref:Uncharacterized protein n=1 Tax=Armillaria solidipes TaxID=1076256 RepID=A0A2H3APV8_9AGAR|nr:hypothetical protein ARMSODRAFT_981928 [Armillaria solidipes]
MSSSATPVMPFVAVKAVITQLCQNLSVTAADNMPQLHEYTKYLEAHKDELIKDKELKETIFSARRTVEKKYHTDASKQPIHKVLKTITGWVQSERHSVEAVPPASAPTGPRRETPVTRSKGKARALKKSPAIVDSGSESEDGEPDKVANPSDSESDSVKIPQMSLFRALTDGILKMSIDDDNSKLAPPKAAKPSKGKPADAVTGEKRKESCKDEPSACFHCGGNDHALLDCTASGAAAVSKRYYKDSDRDSKRSRHSFLHPSAREYYSSRTCGGSDRRASTALGLVSTVSGESGNAALSEALRSTPRGTALDGLRIESSEHLARLENAVLGDLVVLHHTIFSAERQRTFLLSELSGIQGALSAASHEACSPDVASPADPGCDAIAATPVILEPVMVTLTLEVAFRESPRLISLFSSILVRFSSYLVASH